MNFAFQILARWVLFASVTCALAAAESSGLTERTIQQYNQLLNLKRYGQALMHIESALAREPRNPSFLVAKANVYLIQKRYMDAVKLCRQALKVNPRFDWAMSTLGKAYVELERPDLGLQWIEQAIKVSKNPQLSIEKAELLLNLKRHPEAEIAFGIAMKENPKNVDIIVDRAWNLRQMHFDRAEERLLIEAVRRFPDDRRALMAYTNHLKDRRHYPRSLLFLERSEPATNPRYNRGFFTRTGLKGYSLTPIGIPFTVSLSDEVGVEPTNLENLTRSLRGQQIDTLNNVSLLPRPLLVPRNLLKVDLSIFAPLIPIIRVSFVDDRKLNREDGFFEHNTDLLTLSLETTFLWRGVGDVTLLPFFRTSFQGGESLDIRTGNHGEFAINKFTFGLLAYLQPLIGGPLYELELAHAVGSVTDSYLRLGGQIPVNEFLRFNAELNYIWGSEYRFTADFGRFSGRFGAQVGHRDGLRANVELRATVRKDTLRPGPEYTYTYLNPHVGGVIPLHRRWSLDADVGLIRNNRFNEYNGLSGQLGLTHSFFPVFEREMTRAKFPYEAPIELRLGAQVNSFPNFPTGAVSPVGIQFSVNFFL